MSITEIRRDNLKRIIKKIGSQQIFAAKIGITQGQVSQLVTGRGQLGEKLSRKIEMKLGLDKYYLDGGNIKSPVAEEINTEILEQVIENVEAYLDRSGKKLSPQRKAEVVRVMYQMGLADKDILTNGLFDNVLSLIN